MSLFASDPALRVKICGLTQLHDARLAIEAGADALGFNFFRGSKRFLDFAQNREWIAGLAGTVDRVAVVVNPTAAEVAELAESGCFEAIQFHGDETNVFCQAAGFSTWIKAVRVKDDGALQEGLSFATPFLLLDAWSADAFGGTGLRLDWDLAREFVLAHSDRQFLLAGGLTPNNVRDAVRIVRPHAVDVAGGVEMAPGRKDEYLMREFVRVAKAA